MPEEGLYALAPMRAAFALTRADMDAAFAVDWNEVVRRGKTAFETVNENLAARLNETPR